MSTLASLSQFSRHTISHIISNTKRSTIINITHRYTIQYFSTTTQTQTSIPSKPKIPLLKKEYDAKTKTISYVLTSNETSLSHVQSSDNTTHNSKQQETQEHKQHKKEHRITTNALTEYLPSDKKNNKQRDRDQQLKALEQSLMRKYGSEKKYLLKQMRRNVLKQQRALSKEIMNYIDTIPKLNKIKHKFTDKELRKLLLLQEALQISPKQYEKVLKRYPYILKLDIEKDIIPNMKGLKQIFPNQDTLSIFIRAPNIIATSTSTWLTRRDKINNLLGISKDIFINAISKQPSILFNSIIKTTGPKIRFLCDKVRNKYELQRILYMQPSILKVGWGRLARIEFLRSPAVPYIWQHECTQTPPNNKNILGDKNDEDLQDINDKDKNVSKEELNKRKIKKKEKEMNMEWHLNRPCVTWNHSQMKFHYPKYVNFLEEFTLRAKKIKMWTKKNLENISTKEMENIVGEALRRKYVTKKVIGMNWDKKELKRKQNRTVKRIKRKMKEQTPVEKPKVS